MRLTFLVSLFYILLIVDLIVFYDGDCGLCNRSVQFVLKHEKSNVIRFSPLQSQFSKRFFEEHQFQTPDYTTFYFYTNNQLYQKSRAAFKIIPALKWYWQPLRLLALFPSFITDGVYNFIAKRRKTIGGTFCVIPTLENRKRFIEN